MSRPIYESQSDINNERHVAEIMARVWNCEVLKLPRLWPADYCCVRGRNVEAFLEIKVRAYSFETLRAMGGYMIDVRKIAALQSLVAATGKKAFLCVSLQGEVYFMPVASDTQPGQVVMGGRRDRSDAADVEPCAIFAMEMFKPIKQEKV
jgi:hypothetical protein